MFLTCCFSIYFLHYRFIHAHNRKDLPFKLAINHLADRHTTELRRSRGRLVSKGYNGGQPFDTSDIDPADVPDEMDWRLQGKLVDNRHIFTESTWYYM